jgi:RNA polymerase sigma-70 factor (ECF subfamily)
VPELKLTDCHSNTVAKLVLYRNRIDRKVLKELDYKNASLEVLLTLYGQSDPEAFKEFFKRTSKLVFNFLRLKLGSSVEAEDVMQDTYFRVHRFVSTFDESRSAVGWLMTISRNAMADHIKSRKRLYEAASLDGIEHASEEVGSEKLIELRQLVDQTCRELTTDERELLFNRIINESSYEEIAAVRGISVESARQKISRLLKKVRFSLTSL